MSCLLIGPARVTPMEGGGYKKVMKQVIWGKCSCLIMKHLVYAAEDFVLIIKAGVCVQLPAAELQMTIYTFTHQFAHCHPIWELISRFEKMLELCDPSRWMPSLHIVLGVMYRLHGMVLYLDFYSLWIWMETSETDELHCFWKEFDIWWNISQLMRLTTNMAEYKESIPERLQKTAWQCSNIIVRIPK